MSLIKEGLFAAMALFGMSHLAAGQEPVAIVVGDVSLTAADGLVFPAAGVRVTLTCGTDRAPMIEIADERGEFRFANVSVDTCSLLADLQGFKSASAAAVATRDPPWLRSYAMLEPHAERRRLIRLTAPGPGAGMLAACRRANPETLTARGVEIGMLPARRRLTETRA